MLREHLSLVLKTPLWLTTVYSVARYSYRRAVVKRQAEFQGLTDRLAEMTAELAGGARQGRLRG